MIIRFKTGIMKKPLLLLLLSLIGMKASFSQTADDPAWKSIDSLVHAYMDKGKIPGLSIVIVKDGSSFFRTYGYRDLAAKAPVTPLTLFELGSCSKAFTGLAALQMMREHRLDPDAAVSDYLPWFKARYKGAPVKITISQLLHHTSGIPWKTISTIPQRQDANALEQTVRNVSHLSLHHRPGEQYEYATVNYDIVALVIQQLAGRPFESWLQDSIIHRVGLAHTSVGVPSDGRQMALGYKTGFFAPRLYHAPVFRGNYAAGYVISNAVDMGTWLRVQLGAGDSTMNVLTGLSHQRDESVAPAGLYSYAIGWQVSLSGNGEIVHTGENPNFTSYIAFRKARNIGVAVLANSNSSYTPFIGDWIMKRLTGDVLRNDVNPDSGNDKIFSGVSIVLGVFLVTALVCLVLLLSAIFHRRRHWAPPPRTKRWSLLFLTVFLAGVGYAIYLLPQIIGFSWEAMCVWSPVSFITMVRLLAGGIAAGYLLYVLSMFFPGDENKKKEGAVIVGVCTIVGLSNMALILLVTSSFHETGIPIRYQKVRLRRNAAD